jgi:tetratricopeptide (TPR) repeat protein
MEYTSEDSMSVPEEGRFFRKLDWAAFWTATVVSFAVYFYTLAPTLTLEDSGELAVAGDFLGVPHPPGYPIWTIISWIFTKIFAFVTFRGQPNPAWSIGLVSAVFGALAAGVTAMLICRSGSDFLHQSREALHTATQATENLICGIGGVVGSLLFAFSPGMWSQSTIIEVYSLNAFFLVLIFLLTYRWMSRPKDSVLYATGFVFGLGLTNYQVLLLAALPLIIAIMLRDRALFRGFVIVGIPYGIVIKAIQDGYLPAISHPTGVDAFIYMALNLLVLTTVYFFLPRGRTIALTILMAEIGVAFYGYMPLASDLRNPPMNWGFPRTWEGFKHALTRGQYEKIKPISDVFSPLFIEQLGSYFEDLRKQFTLPVALLGFLPFTVWKLKAGNRDINALHIGIIFALAATIVLAFEKALAAAGVPMAFRLDKGLSGIVLLVVGAGGLTILVTLLWEFIDDIWGRNRALFDTIVVNTWAGLIGIALIYVGVTRKNMSTIVILLGLIGVFFLINHRWRCKGDKPEGRKVSLPDVLTVVPILLVGVAIFAVGARGIWQKVISITAPLREEGANPTNVETTVMMLQSGGLVLIVVLLVLLIALAAWLSRSKYKLRMTIDDNSQKWVVATLAGFMVMSLVLIVLANPKGDVQDDFIQRVKFISSHALFAIWIGYGLIFGLAWVDTVFRKTPLIRPLSLCIAALLVLVPIRENAFNHELIRLYGAAEQHGHDFGWQFGNYQLRGANAISEELEPTEEPLPNPQFPPEMTQDAIFFGGTDPGRFVPTYMIYSAQVREDVYLITQNALADNTFMNVTRDLYGDQIWIPAIQDSAKAFQVYVEEVQAGKRLPHADLKIDGGRVQVSGALGVMEINGILCNMIFDHNNYKHDFYVEESYVIRWMYPYLTPHGLIMKINQDKTPFSSNSLTAINDLEFWDWYTRKQHSNPKFLRDVVARKSFSKLRSALGGLYANRRQFANAERAFHEARILYPLSPEANFRLTQEILLPMNRFAESLWLMNEYAKSDPGNRRVPSFIAHIENFKRLRDKIREMESENKAGKFEATTALQLADLYRQAQQSSTMMRYINSILQISNLPPEYAYQAATILHKSKKYADMDRALQLCLKTIPDGSQADLFLNITKMYYDAKMLPQMVSTMQRYLKIKPDDWKAWLDLSLLQLNIKKVNDAVKSLGRARQLGGAEVERIIRTDEGNRFAPILRASQPATPRQPERSLQGIPGITPGG